MSRFSSGVLGQCSLLNLISFRAGLITDHWFEVLSIKLGQYLIQEVTLVYLDTTVFGAVNEHSQEHVVVDVMILII